MHVKSHKLRKDNLLRDKEANIGFFVEKIDLNLE